MRHRLTPVSCHLYYALQHASAMNGHYLMRQLKQKQYC
jgi:hypothetical protein